MKQSYMLEEFPSLSTLDLDNSNIDHEVILHAKNGAVLHCGTFRPCLT